MKLTLFTILALCIIAVCKSAEEEYDYEEEAAAPVTPAPTKPAASGRLGGLLSSRGRVNAPNIGKKKTPTQSTTSKPVEQAPEEDVIEGEDALDENQENEEPTTTTESTKKLRNNGGVRPFRSNEDLLAALKRRRAQTGTSSHSRETTATQSAVEHTTAKLKASTTNNRSKASTGSETRTSGRGRFGGKGKIVQEEVEETQREEVQVKPKASSYRKRS